MKLFSAIVRLSGSRDNEVRRNNLTAPEIQLLRVLHGGDENVREIKHVANVKRSDIAERARLAALYSKTDPNGFKSGEDLVLMYFGAPGVPLPQEAVNPAPAAVDDDEIEASGEEVTPVEDIETLDKPVRVDRAQRTKKPADVAELIA